ncbi:DNA-directed RNA polymerase subunit beta [Paenibacillus hodogayensis]|uniref:DNA-directed RNA polymerase subunit beta n=1 Tax=Paenibacillus hodogayensis TaxID=279208 RepID=A0ABV5W896_9BACL
MNDQETNVHPVLEPKPQEKPKQQEKPKSKRKLKRRWVRIILWILRALLVPFLCAVALLVGLWVGYAYIGGKSGADVWEWTTWRHVFDLIFGN